MMLNPENFKDFLQQMLGKSEPEYEAICQLTEEQLKEWNECQRLLQEAMIMADEAKARKDLLWAKIRRSLGPNSKDSLKIENGLLWGSIDTPKERSGSDLPFLPEED